jgi:RES domain-containing protein
MRAWRIAKKSHALDRSGGGGFAEAGRWHEQGQAVIYAGLTPEICVLEKLAHTGQLLPADLVLVELSLPEGTGLYLETPFAELPSGWDVLPPGTASAAFGSRFLRGGQALGLIVPSAIVPEGRNILINPLHPAIAQVTMTILRPYRFDQRLR